MKSKNIIFFMPFIGGGGVEKNLFIIANHFSKKIKKLIICTSSRKYKYRFSKKIKFLSPKKNINEKVNIRLQYIISLFLLFKFLLKNKNTTVFAFQANIYCIIICKLLNIKVVIRSNSSPEGWYHNPIKKIIYKKIISLADAIIVNSIQFKKQMETKFNIKVHCIYNPLDIKEITKKSKIKISEKFFKQNNNFLKLINIGRFTEQKDQITILKAINLIKNKIKIKLIIMGRGYEEEKLRKYINENNLSKIVKLKGFSNNPYNLLNLSNVFILSSKYEGLPNVLLESVVLKKFIISTDCPTGPREILSKGKGSLFFKIGDHKDLSKKIIYYNSNKKTLNKGLIYPFKNLKRFSYEKNLEKYFNLLNKI